MKTLVFILTICLLSTGVTSYAQSNNLHKNTQHHTQPPAITKGYYAIGNNAAKLSGPNAPDIRITAGESYPVVQKGYYSIAKNNRKLGKQLVIEQSVKSTVPVATKGYYSIDRNKGRVK